MDREKLVSRGILVIGRDDVFQAGFLGKVINVANQSITVHPGPVYWSQQRTYHRYAVNPPIKVGLREVHESSPSIFVRLVDISMGGAAFIADNPGISTNQVQRAVIPSSGQLFWVTLPRPECGDSLELAATFVNQRQIPKSRAVLWAFAWQQVTVFSDLEAWIEFHASPIMFPN
ncbi:PilZ domain-containing protein [Acidithiobacillus ferrivorans]|nr:PilZ domain-containing protein [Acidithiobacillus ferrivorans]